MNKPKVYSVAHIGIEAAIVTVEADISFGLPAFHIVGLPDVAIKESRERIRAAITNSGFTFPRTRVTVNLAPADIKKQGPIFDFPIALSILLAQGEFDPSSLHNTLILGELALDGGLRPVTGALVAARTAKESKPFNTVFLPEENAQEALYVKGINVLAPKSLREAVEHFQKTNILFFKKRTKQIVQTPCHEIDFQTIKGQAHAKRGLEIAAAGGHNILLHGPPGTGKTLLARALPSILPPLTYEEALETTAIASVARTYLSKSGLVNSRPFRHPHHSCSAVSLVGGGAWPKPGEVSLAHRGVLFLDELPEFSRFALEHLRQPLEDGEVVVSRASACVKFPARFLLVAAMNPCPCGFLHDPHHACVCSQGAIARYRQKISGPLLDRFDMMIDVPKIETATLLSSTNAEPSDVIRGRVQAARKRQQKRFASTAFFTNAEIPTAKIKEWCAVSQQAENLFAQAMDKNLLSARGYHRTLKLSRTIADIEGNDDIKENHVAEALQYRPRHDSK